MSHEPMSRWAGSSNAAYSMSKQWATPCQPMRKAAIRCSSVLWPAVTWLSGSRIHRLCGSFYIVFVHFEYYWDFEYLITRPSESWQIFQIGTVRYAEGLCRMCRHGPVIEHCTDSEDFPESFLSKPLWRKDPLSICCIWKELSWRRWFLWNQYDRQ